MKKYLFILAMLLFSAADIYAEVRQHVVERGETLASIAKMYGMSENALIEANPSAAEYLYSGTVLDIPEVDAATAQPSISSHNDMSVSEQSPVYNQSDSQVAVSSAQDQSVWSGVSEGPAGIECNLPSCFSKIYLTYMANFKAFDKGYYGLGWDMYWDNGWGLTLSYLMSYGLVKPGGFMFAVGPQYGYAINKYFLPALKLKAHLETYDVLTSITYSSYSYSGDNVRQNTSMVVGGGLWLTPCFNMKFGPILIGIGYNLGFASYRGSVPGVSEYTRGGYVDGNYSSTSTTEKEFNREQITSFSHSFELQIGFHF